MCESPIFGQVLSNRAGGAFASYRELSAFFKDGLRRALEFQVAPPLFDMGNFDDSAPLVLTHQDLNMRNFIVGDDGRLSLTGLGLGFTLVGLSLWR